MADGTKQRIDTFIKFSQVAIVVPQIEGVNLLNFSELYRLRKTEMLNYAFTSKYLLRYKRMSDTDKHYVWGYNIESICNGNAKVWMYEDRVSGIKKDYLRATCKESDYNYIIATTLFIFSLFFIYLRYKT
jgi:hypothetical protein